MLTLVTAATALPISLADMKQHLRVSHADDDQMIEHLLQSAVLMIGEAAGRALAPTEWQMSVPAVSGLLRLPYPPVTEITGISITAPDGTDTDLPLDGFRLTSSDDLAFVEPVSGVWPATAVRSNAIRVGFTAGYVTCPKPLIQAVVMMVKRDFDGLAGADAAACEKAIQALVSAYRVGWVSA